MGRFGNDTEFEEAMKEKNPEKWEIDDIYTDIIANIIDRRDKLGWSQEELAEKCGLKQSAIARFEMCTNVPRLNTVLKIIVALGLRLSVIRKQNEDKKIIDIEEWKRQNSKPDEYNWVDPDKKDNVMFEGLAISYIR